MKYSALLALFAISSASAIKIDARPADPSDEPAPTAADTPSSGYFGADEDDVMNNIFNHYAVPVTNAAGQATGAHVLYREGAMKACAEILLVTK